MYFDWPYSAQRTPVTKICSFFIIVWENAVKSQKKKKKKKKSSKNLKYPWPWFKCVSEHCIENVRVKVIGVIEDDYYYNNNYRNWLLGFEMDEISMNQLKWYTNTFWGRNGTVTSCFIFILLIFLFKLFTKVC